MSMYLNQDHRSEKTLTNMSRPHSIISSEWPFSSSHFDPVSMRASNLQRVRNWFEFAQDPALQKLFCFGVGSNASHTSISRCDTERARHAFLDRLHNEESSLTALYFHLGIGEALPRLSMDRDTWDWILDEFDIYPEWPDIIRHSVGRYSKAVTYCKETKKPKVYHIMVNHPDLSTAAGKYKNGFYIQYHFQTGKVVMLCHCTLPDFSSSEVQDRHSQTGGAWPDRGKPFSLALDRLVNYLEDLNPCHEIRWPAIWDMENQIQEDITQCRRESERPDLEVLDLEANYTIGARVRYIMSQVDFQSRLSEFLLQTFDHFVSLRKEADKVHDTVETEAMSLALEAHRDRVIERLYQWRQYLNTAEHQSSMADTIVSTRIAEQSHLTANEARKDNTAMKTIAGLGMVYLPSTFVATIFGMGFFTFDSGDKGGPMQVHPEFWKFIVIALTLSVFTITVWKYLNANGTPWWLHGSSVCTATRSVFRRKGRVKDSSPV